MNKIKILHNLDKVKQEIASWFYEYYTGELLLQDAESDYSDTYWIGRGFILQVGDIYVNLHDIVDIMTENIPCEVFSDWYDYSLEQSYLDEGKRDGVNLVSYARMRGTGKHADYLAFKADQDRIRETPEHKAQVDAELKKIYDEGVKEIEKYINK